MRYVSNSHESSAPRSRARRGLLGWIIGHPKTSIAIAFLLLAAGAYYGIEYLAEQRFERRIADIRAKGEPLTMEDIRRLDPGIPEEENMTTALLKAARPFLDLIQPPDGSPSEFGVISNLPQLKPGERAKPEYLASARRFIEHSPDALTEMHEAARMERAWFDWKWKSPYFHTQLPELSQTGRASGILLLDSLLGVEDGNQDRAVRSLVDSLRVCRAFDSPWQNVMGVGLRTKYLNNSIDQAGRVVSGFTLNSGEIERIKQELRHFSRYRSPSESILVDRAVHIDSLALPEYQEMIYGINQSVRSRAVDWHQLSAARALDAARSLERFRQVLDESDCSESEMPARIDEWERQNSSIPDYCVMTRYWVPAFGLNLRRQHAAIGRARAALAAFAAEEYRLVNNDWPDNLDMLVPDFLDAAPLDPFDGRPIRYEVIAEGIKTWSIGEDRTDEGGNFEHLANIATKPRPSDVGFFITNAEYRVVSPQTSE